MPRFQVSFHNGRIVYLISLYKFARSTTCITTSNLVFKTITQTFPLLFVYSRDRPQLHLVAIRHQHMTDNFIVSLVAVVVAIRECFGVDSSIKSIRNL